MNHDETKQTDPLDHPELAAALAPPLLALLRRINDGDEEARSQALPGVAALVDAFSALELLEFAYLAPGSDDEDEGPIAWFEATEAIFDKERDTVVIAGSEILEVLDGPITLEDPPEHEHEVQG